MIESESIVVIGSGGHAFSCIDVIESMNTYKIVGLTGLKNEIGSQRFGYQVIAGDEDYESLAAAHKNAIVSIGYIKNVEKRIELFKKAVNAGFNLPVITSKKAYVSQHANIGKGSIVMHGAILNAGVTVGENCIINSNALIEHGVEVGDHCHISTGSIINGDVCIQEGTFVGSGAVIMQGIKIGRLCTIGMNTSVKHDMLDETLYKGD